MVGPMQWQPIPNSVWLQFPRGRPSGSRASGRGRFPPHSPWWIIGPCFLWLQRRSAGGMGRKQREGGVLHYVCFFTKLGHNTHQDINSRHLHFSPYSFGHVNTGHQEREKVGGGKEWVRLEFVVLPVPDLIQKPPKEVLCSRSGRTRFLTCCTLHPSPSSKLL